MDEMVFAEKRIPERLFGENHPEAPLIPKDGIVK